MNGEDEAARQAVGMPKKLEAKLKREAKRRHFGKKRTNAYIYGTLRRTGWKPRRKR